MSSHLNLFLTLAHELVARRHRVTFFGISDSEEKIRGAGIGFELLEPDTVPVGTLGSIMREMSTRGNFASMRLQGRFDELRYEGILSKGPAIVKAAGVDALIVDQAEACSGSVADFVGLPWVSVCSGLCLNSEKNIPPFLTAWPYSISKLAILRNKAAYAILRVAMKPTRKLINKSRKRWKLKLLTKMDDAFSPVAQICQQNKEFDFPRACLPANFHYVGPIRPRVSTQTPFPWDRLDGRPLIYASLGTVMNRHKRLYRVIADACAGLDAQLVMSLGGAGEVDAYRDLPGRPIVVTYAPQRELIRKATLTITHAGLNTTLESLSEGVPLVAIPITFEQPAIASRIRWTGTGDFVSYSKASPERLRKVVAKVLGDPSYRVRAADMKEKLSRTGGCAQAADVIERVLQDASANSKKSAAAN